MKNTIVVLFLVAVSFAASAQKSNLYADVGISMARVTPGFSVTYNYRFVKWLGIGAGVQGYAFFPTIVHSHRFVPAVYGDLRFNIRPLKKHQFFVLFDYGVDFYKRSDEIEQRDSKLYAVSKANGAYTGLGIGYFKRTTDRGSGPYVSLKLISNGYKVRSFNYTTLEERDELLGRGTLVISGGFKF